MRYGTAVGHLRRIVQECERQRRWPEGPIITAAYAFGDVVEGVDPLERIQVAFVVDVPTDEVTWNAESVGFAALAELAGFGKLPLEWWWRPAVWPVWNHHIRNPVQFWSLDGPDEAALTAFAERRFDDIQREPLPDASEQRRWLREEATAGLEHLRVVVDRYHDSEWRREHRGGGTRPEDHLWRAAWGYLDLRRAVVDQDARGG